MNVAQYTFQSPSANQVQIGKLDPSSVKEETTSAPQQTSVQAKTAGEILTADTSSAIQITPTVNENRLLDIYA